MTADERGWGREFGRGHLRSAATLMKELRETKDPRVVGGAERLEAYPYYGGGGGKRPGWRKRKK